MGRGTFEHNYQALNLSQLRTTELDVAPVALAVPTANETTATEIDLYCGDNLAVGR